MTETFRKLNLGTHDPVLILSSPPEFSAELATVAGERVVKTVPEPGERYAFILAFGTMKESIREVVVRALDCLAPEGTSPVLWIAYPKQSSRRYRADVNRDSLWELLKEFGIHPVRQVAIDEDWSALRFRRD